MLISDTLHLDQSRRVIRPWDIKCQLFPRVYNKLFLTQSTPIHPLFRPTSHHISRRLYYLLKYAHTMANMKEQQDFEKTGGGSSPLWNFENLRGSDNWKSWNRQSRNALFAMVLLHTIDGDPLEEPSVFQKLVTDAGGVQTMVPMNQAEMNEALDTWANETKLDNSHSRIARGYLYTKLSATPKYFVENLIFAKEFWARLKKQYFDTSFAVRYKNGSNFQNYCEHMR